MWSYVIFGLPLHPPTSIPASSEVAEFVESFATVIKISSTVKVEVFNVDMKKDNLESWLKLPEKILFRQEYYQKI